MFEVTHTVAEENSIKGPDNPTYETLRIFFLKHKAVRVSIASTTWPCQELYQNYTTEGWERGVGE